MYCNMSQLSINHLLLSLEPIELLHPSQVPKKIQDVSHPRFLSTCHVASQKMELLRIRHQPGDPQPWHRWSHRQEPCSSCPLVGGWTTATWQKNEAVEPIVFAKNIQKSSQMGRGPSLSKKRCNYIVGLKIRQMSASPWLIFRPLKLHRSFLDGAIGKKWMSKTLIVAHRNGWPGRWCRFQVQMRKVIQITTSSDCDMWKTLVGSSVRIHQD